VGIEDLHKQYLAGKTLQELAVTRGVVATTVGRWFKAAGLSRRGPTERSPRVVDGNSVRVLYEQGLSAVQVADRLHVSKKTVLNRLRELEAVRSSYNLDWQEEAQVLYTAGRTTPEIAILLGKSPAAVYRAIKRRGIIRSVGHYSKLRVGAKNPNWRGGSSFRPYPAAFCRALKEQVKQRDGACCQLCGITEEEHRKLYRAAHGDRGQGLTVHHVDYDKSNTSLTNLITLCLACNPKVNSNREHWMALFKTRLEGCEYGFNS
jgi:DNA-binding Lrp family transcriptional regulator